MGILFWRTDKVLAEVERRLNRGLTAGANVLLNRIKEKLSVPAPRVLVTSKKGIPYYRATTRATPGAPPRKLSGRLRASGSYEVDIAERNTRIVFNTIYAIPLDTHMNHPYLSSTLPEAAAEMKEAMKRAMEM